MGVSSVTCVVVYTVAETVGVKTEGGNKEGKERDWGIKIYTSEYIKTTRDKIKTNQMDLIKLKQGINKNANHTIFYIQG